MNEWLKGGLIGAVLLTTLWWLAPRPSQQQEREEGAVEIQYMSPEGPIKEAMDDAVREFEYLSRVRHQQDVDAGVENPYPLYKVVAGQHASRNQVEDPTRFLLSLVGGEPPDVIFFDRFAISEWASRGAFRQLDEFVDRDDKLWSDWEQSRESDPKAPPPWPGALAEPPRAEGAEPLAEIEPVRQEDFFAACWGEAVFTNPRDGSKGLYGIPSNADDRVLLYNKDILIRSGYTNELGEAKPPTTWEEMKEMAVNMTERDDKGNIKTIGFIPNYGNSWLYLYGWQAGGEFMSEDGRQATLNDPNIAYALQFMTDIYDDLGGAKDVYAFQSTFQGDALDPFILGKVAMKIDGVWIMSSLSRFGRDLNIGAAPPPMPARELAKGREPISWVGGWAYAIPSTSKQKDGAWELIRYLVSQRALEITTASEQYTYRAQGREYIPRQYPNRKQNQWAYDKYVSKSDVLEPKFKQGMAMFNSLLESSRYRPVTPVGQKLWNEHKAAMEDAIFQKKTPQESLDYHNAIVQRDLDNLLNPPAGKKITSWTWFFWLYGAVVVGVITLVYLWDSKPEWREKFSGRKSKFSLLKLFGGEDDMKPAVIDGKKGSYFRAQWKEGIICASPWIIGFILFTGGPLLFSIVISFCRFDILNEAVFTGMNNYSHMVQHDELFWKSMWNTLFMVLGVPLGMAVGLGIALLLCSKVRGIAVWRTFFYLPSIVPMVAASILWIWIFNPQSGLLNGMLESIGIKGPLWLQDEHTSKWALIIMGLWAAGGGMIIWIAGIKGISESYYEAASIDGANWWQQFKFITIPMLTPYIFFNLIMGLIGTFQIFAQAFIMTSGGPVNSTLFYVYHLFNNAFRYLHMGYAAAMAWFLFIIVLILTAFQMRMSNKWVHYEGD